MNDMNFGYVILCPEPNIGLLQNTAKSIKLHSNLPFNGVVAGDTPMPVIKEMKANVCTIYKAKTTITSMLNTGLRNSLAEWTIFVMAGTWVKKDLPKKYKSFINGEHDVMFPIVDKHYTFPVCSLNGLCINKRTFKKAGPFREEGELNEIKEEWSLWATALCDAKFKAILGAKIV